MELRKYELAQAGDKVKFIVNVAMKEDPLRGYTHNVQYDGIVVRNSGYSTDIEFIGDDKQKHSVCVYNYGINSGYESFELIVEEDEIEKRKLQWIEQVIKEETEKFNKRMDEFKTIKLV